MAGSAELMRCAAGAGEWTGGGYGGGGEDGWGCVETKRREASGINCGSRARVARGMGAEAVKAWGERMYARRGRGAPLSRAWGGGSLA